MSWWWAVLLVPQSTTPILLRTTNTTLCYSSTTLYYKVLLKYYSVLLQYYLEYKVLLQYYPVLQSTTPVLLCTTKYYSSTTLYYKVVLQYYSVLQILQSTTQVLLRTTPVLPWLQSTTPVLTCTTKYYSSTNLYYKVLLQYYLVLQSTTPVLPGTTKYYSSTTLYYKVLHDWSASHMKRHLQCAEQQANTAPARQNDSHDWSASHMKRHLQWAEQQASRSNFTKYCTCHAKWISWLIHITYETSFTMRGATVNTLQPHQILRLPRKMNLMIDPHHIWNVIYKCAEQQSTPSYLTKYCACQAKWISGLIRITYETSFTMRGATGITLQPHHILRLPRKMKRISNARSNKRQPPTSPNTAPATQNECHLWSVSYMKRHFQCAEQAKSPFKLTKYCACHQILSSRFDREISELLPPIERRFEHIPTISDDNPTQNRHLAPAASEAFAVWSWRRFWIGKYKFTRSGYLLKMSRSAAPATKSHSQTSPNSVLARQNECHQWSASHMKRHFQCAEQAKSPSNLTKYCACHAKWISWLIGVT